MSRRSAGRIDDARQVANGCVGHLADAVHVLLPEAEPEPGVDQCCVVRRDQGVVRVLPASTHRGAATAYRSRTTSASLTACPADSTQAFGPHTGLSLVWPSR